MEPHTFETSNSRMGLFLKCRKAYHYRHKLLLVPRIEAPQLRRGTLCHAGMRAGLFAQYGGQTMPDAISSCIYEMWEEWVKNPLIESLLGGMSLDVDGTVEDESAQMRDDCTSIVLRAFERLGIFAGLWETQVLDGKPLIEYALEDAMPFRKGLHIKTTGTLDWVARDIESGHIWLIDWKFRRALVDDDAYDDPNSQAGTYQHLLYRRGLVLNGTATAQIRAAVPKVPTVNKGKGAHQGKMTRSPRSTDWPTYSQACVDAGLDPNDYADVQAKLKPFERLTYNYRSPREVKAMWNNTQSVAAEMVDAIEEDYPYRSMSPHKCRGCEYLDPCLEELRGGDVDVLLKTLYMHVRDQPASWAYHPPEREEEQDPEGEDPASSGWD